MKNYDRRYFERWYRDPDDRVSTRESLERKVRMAVAVAEFLLGRRIRTVLDVGCGEAPWSLVLHRIRRDVRYTGVDSSDYVLDRFGKSRHIRRGTLGGLHELRLRPPFDLIVCADVLQYVETKDAERGLKTIRQWLGGVAYIESFTTLDAMEGDRTDWIERDANEYRRMFSRAGLTQCGPYCYTDLNELETLNEFEYCG
jgi:SAM-dependent methyltransferase